MKRLSAEGNFCLGKHAAQHKRITMLLEAQIKEMEDAGWIYRGKSVTACPIHTSMVRKGGVASPGEKQKWRITCDYSARWRLVIWICERDHCERDHSSIYRCVLASDLETFER